MSGRGWKISVGIADRVEEDDIPESVRDALPGIVALVELNLAPISAPQKAQRRLHEVARRLARDAKGVIEDPQTGELETPRGVKRFVKQEYGSFVPIEYDEKCEGSLPQPGRPQEAPLVLLRK